MEKLTCIGVSEERGTCCAWPELELVVTMPLAMPHLRSFHESMLKAARPYEHLIWRALTDFGNQVEVLIVKSDSRPRLAVVDVAQGPWDRSYLVSFSIVNGNSEAKLRDGNRKVGFQAQISCSQRLFSVWPRTAIISQIGSKELSRSLIIIIHFISVPFFPIDGRTSLPFNP